MKASARRTRCPFGNAAVRRDQHGAGFVAPADQLEEQVRRVGLERQVAELVDDQQLRLRQRQQFLVQAPLAVRLREARGQRRRRRELHRVSGQDRLSPERDRQVRLADTWRTSVTMPGVWDLRCRSSTRSIPDVDTWWAFSAASNTVARSTSSSGSQTAH